jgi:alkyl hydroperoxide reductase subunit AhpC
VPCGLRTGDWGPVSPTCGLGPQGAITRAYGVCLECKEPSRRALFVIDERGLIRWSQAYRSLVNPGVDGILRVLEVMGTISRADQTTDAIGR